MAVRKAPASAPPGAQAVVRRRPRHVRPERTAAIVPQRGARRWLTLPGPDRRTEDSRDIAAWSPPHPVLPGGRRCASNCRAAMGATIRPTPSREMTSGSFDARATGRLRRIDAPPPELPAVPAPASRAVPEGSTRNNSAGAVADAAGDGFSEPQRLAVSCRGCRRPHYGCKL
jgi:hypothetical protein